MEEEKQLQRQPLPTPSMKLRDSVTIYSHDDGSSGSGKTLRWRRHAIRVWSLSLCCALLLLVVLSQLNGVSVLKVLNYGVGYMRSAHGISAPALPHPPAQPLLEQEAVLTTFQVAPPVLRLSPNSSSNNSSDSFCTKEQLLVAHTFANSYGRPYRSIYAAPSPPPNCLRTPTPNNTTPPRQLHLQQIILTLLVTSQGRQFDRLATFTIRGAEVWRTSTAEPTIDGIVWRFEKDVTAYRALFEAAQPGELVFDLGNLVNEIYTAPFHVRLTGTFIFGPADGEEGEAEETPADAIAPLTFERKHGALIAPFHLPHTTRRAILSLAATGQGIEEFFYTNTLSPLSTTFPANPIPAHSPFRELQVYINGRLTGVIWPFPVIFTGGIVPGFWRPVVGIDAFDLRDGVVDVTPFVGEGGMRVEVVVAGVELEGGKWVVKGMREVGEEWVVSGKVFVWDGDCDGDGDGGAEAEIEWSSTVVEAPEPSVNVSYTIATSGRGDTLVNETLSYSVAVSRHLHIHSTRRHHSGALETVSWRQDLAYSSTNTFTNRGVTQFTSQRVAGVERAPALGYERRFSYPLALNASTEVAPRKQGGNLTIRATLDRGVELQVVGDPMGRVGLRAFGEVAGARKGGGGEGMLRFRGSRLWTRQNGSAFYTSKPKAPQSVSFGATEQVMVFEGLGREDDGGQFVAVGEGDELYYRHVLAVNSTLVEDEERLVGESVGSQAVVVQEPLGDFAPLVGARYEKVAPPD